MKLKYGNTYKELDENYLKKLREITSEGDIVCTAVSDITRAYIKSNIWLEYIIAELSILGVNDENIKILSVNGAHRKRNANEHVLVLGDKLKDRFQIIDHECMQ